MHVTTELLRCICVVEMMSERADKALCNYYPTSIAIDGFTHPWGFAEIIKQVTRTPVLDTRQLLQGFVWRWSFCSFMLRVLILLQNVATMHDLFKADPSGKYDGKKQNQWLRDKPEDESFHIVLPMWDTETQMGSGRGRETVETDTIFRVNSVITGHGETSTC